MQGGCVQGGRGRAETIGLVGVRNRARAAIGAPRAREGRRGQGRAAGEARRGGRYLFVWPVFWRRASFFYILHLRMANPSVRLGAAKEEPEVTFL